MFWHVLPMASDWGGVHLSVHIPEPCGTRLAIYPHKRHHPDDFVCCVKHSKGIGLPLLALA